jgi:hypothetical protein
MVILQNEIAARQSETGDFKRLIWIPPAAGNTITNEKMVALQQTFINELRNNADIQKGADILEGPLEAFKLAIFDTIKRIKEEEEAKKAVPAIAYGITPGPEAARTRMIYLLCDQRDLDDIMPLEALIMDSGHEMLLPLFDGDQVHLRQAHLENLKICDAIIIYYGSGNYRWVGSMKSDLMRLPAMGRANPLVAKAIYITGPADNQKESFKSNDIEIINGLTGFNPDMFGHFIQKLK